MLDGAGVLYSSTSSSAAVAEECFAPDFTLLLNKRKRNKNKRRFTDDQIRSMETIFESETKLEPRKKLQLATELGLQPRQVAIWFQNKRARWKSKQLERDFTLLQANYTSLASRFDCLKQERQSLLDQLQKLKEATEKSHKEERRIVGVSDMKGGDLDVKSRLFVDRSPLQYNNNGVLSDDDSSMIKPAEYLETTEPLNMVEPGDSNSFTSPRDKNFTLESDIDLLEDQPSSSHQWWDFWA